MAEAFGVAAGVIAVLQITSSVLSVCYDYNAAIRDAPWELPRIQQELEDLRNVLQRLEPLTRHAEISDPAQLQTLNLLCGPLQTFLEVIKQLKEKLEPPEWTKKWGPKRKALVQSLRWPIKEVETKIILVMIGRFKETLQLAFHADQTTLTLEIQKLSLSTYTTAIETQKDVRSTHDTLLQARIGIQEIEKSAAAIHWDTQREKIYRWLAAPDPSTNYNRARHTRQDDTGLWFLHGAFNDWIKKAQVMWLHGKAGCGKTVLSSIIISEVDRICRFDGVAVTYFYFDFNDTEKQDANKMICSIIKQLVSQSTNKCIRLESLFSTCNDGARQPNSDDLMLVLEGTMKAFDKVYIILDALDECSDRHNLLEKIEKIQNWRLSQLHMLLTSRALTDIEEALEPMIDVKSRICIQNAAVNADIGVYVDQMLQKDRHLKRWRNHKQAQKEIRKALKEKADGMFRWAVCQLNALQDCCDLKTLRKTLASLPPTLDETYARILCKIPEDYSEHALRILQWLAYSRRPLKIKELAEVVAVDPNGEGDSWFDHEARFLEPRDILKICAGLVVEEHRKDNDNEEDDEDNDESNESDKRAEYEEDIGHYGYQNEDDQDQQKYVGGVFRDDSSEVIEEIGPQSHFNVRPNPKNNNIIRLAHFSVKEYLVSKRIRDQDASIYAKKASRYAIQEISAHRSIASHCLAYLLQFEQYGLVCDKGNEYLPERFIISGYPLSSYAAREWIEHVKFLDIDLGSIETLSLKLFLLCKKAYLKWEHLCKSYNEQTDNPPLYNASRFGAIELVQLLLNKGEDVNVQGGFYHTALQLASFYNHLEVVRLLLDNEADVNAHGGFYHSALQAASRSGHFEIVRLLLDSEADVNAQGGHYHTALIAASTSGHFETVRLLLDNEADVNARGGHYHTALIAASTRGHFETVRLLLDNEADVNAQGEDYHTALIAASRSNRFEIVRLLLDNEADVNAQGGFYHTALHAASFRGAEESVRILLSNRADVNHSGHFSVPSLHQGGYGTALHAASAAGQRSNIKLLLDYEADVNAVGIFNESKMTALQLASQRGVFALWINKTYFPRTMDFEGAVQLLQSAQDSQRSTEQSRIPGETTA